VSDILIRHQSVRRSSFIVMLVGLIIGLSAVAAGIYLLVEMSDARGTFAVVGGLMLAIFPVLVHMLVLLVIKAESNINRVHHDLLDLLDVAGRFSPLVRSIAENSAYSDAARSIAHREHEREALRQAIRDEMYGGDWEAAFYLIDQMEKRFGYQQEAKTLRAEIAQAREMTIEEKINEAVTHIEKMMDGFEWDRARQESERLMKLFPRHERVQKLPTELARRREARKQALLLKWSTAVERSEIDEGITVLTELDQYLSPEEAQGLRDSARHVFKARLLNLGVRFSLAASEARWRDALEIGLQLRQEFPNSRMAQEVAEKIDILRVRAGFGKDAEVVQRRSATTPQ
jgi:hypothetical protein